MHSEGKDCYYDLKWGKLVSKCYHKVLLQVKEWYVLYIYAFKDKQHILSHHFSDTNKQKHIGSQYLLP